MWLYKLLFVANAYLLLFPIYLINKEIAIYSMLNVYAENKIFSLLFNELSFVIYIAIPIITTLLSCVTFKKLSVDEIKQQHISRHESAGSRFIITFFTCIFIGLSVNGFISLVMVYTIIVLFGVMSEMYLYNPIFLLFGYKYYFVTVNDIRILIMTKKVVKLNENVSYEKLARINEFTYIDLCR